MTDQAVLRTSVLVVDDEPQVVWVLQFSLEAEGYTTFAARDGVQAMSAIAEHHPQLMLLDIMAGSIMAGTVPTSLRSRVSGAFMVVNYGVRPLGTTLGGILGTVIGVRSTLWIATVGALLGLAFLLPSPIPKMRDVPAEAPE